MSQARAAQVQVAEAPLSAAQVRRWGQLDPMVRRSEKDSFESDVFLFEINQGRLYRADPQGRFRSFESYLEYLGIPRSSGWERVAAGEAMQRARTSGAEWQPKNRHQAKQLAGLDPDALCRVLEIASEREKAGKRPLTAEQLAAIVEEATGRPPGAMPGEVSEEVAQAVSLGELEEEEIVDLMALGAPPVDPPVEGGQVEKVKEQAPRPRIPPGSSKLHKQAKWLGTHLEQLRRQAEKEGHWLVRMVERWQDALARTIIKKLQKGSEEKEA